MLPILAVVCPPLAVLVVAGGRAAAANLGLTLLGIVPGVRHARELVERYTVERQYDAVMRVLEGPAA